MRHGGSSPDIRRSYVLRLSLLSLLRKRFAPDLTCFHTKPRVARAPLQVTRSFSSRPAIGTHVTILLLIHSLSNSLEQILERVIRANGYSRRLVFLETQDSSREYPRLDKYFE